MAVADQADLEPCNERWVCPFWRCAAPPNARLRSRCGGRRRTPARARHHPAAAPKWCTAAWRTPCLAEKTPPPTRRTNWTMSTHRLRPRLHPETTLSREPHSFRWWQCRCETRGLLLGPRAMPQQWHLPLFAPPRSAEVFRLCTSGLLCVMVGCSPTHPSSRSAASSACKPVADLDSPTHPATVACLRTRRRNGRVVLDRHFVRHTACPVAHCAPLMANARGSNGQVP